MPDNYLVTGSRGGSSPHVTSSQARNFNAGIVGNDRYVMEGLECTVSSANKVHVSPGVACFCGADVEVPPGGADLTIDNGSQGMKRNDLVVLRYENGSPEKVTLAVIKGTPAASSPADPSYNEGDIRDGDSPVDMPLWRIPLDGISVGSPVPIYKAVPSMAELRDSVSQPAEWTQLATGCWYAVKSGWCCVSCEGLLLTKGQQRLVGRLPVGAPAGHNVVCVLIGYDGSGGPWAGTVAHLTVNAAGNVFGWTNGSTGAYQGTVCFPVG